MWKSTLLSDAASGLPHAVSVYIAKRAKQICGMLGETLLAIGALMASAFMEPKPMGMFTFILDQNSGQPQAVVANMGKDGKLQLLNVWIGLKASIRPIGDLLKNITVMFIKGLCRSVPSRRSACQENGTHTYCGVLSDLSAIR